MTRRNARPQPAMWPGVPTESAALLDIAGPMGRGYLRLPCKCQRAALANPDLHIGDPYLRTCQRCKIRYQITVIRPLPQDTRLTARITRLT